jgi:hypothetical protein
MRRSKLLTLVMIWGLSCARTASAEGPAEALLKLVPSESGATLAVEDLRERAREIVGSPLYEGLLRLPTVRTWMASEPFRKAERTSQIVQKVLGVPLTTIRDELLGDAFVLALQAGPSGKPEQSRGLLLARPRDRAMIERLIAAFNNAQSGELAGVESRSRGPLKYSARLYKAAGRPPEFYVLLDDGTFAWSNSEATIQGVIERQVSQRPGLAADTEFRKVREGLPARPLASLFVNARFLERALSEAPRPAGDKAAAMIARYIRAVGHFGLALDWRGGIFLHSCETVAPEKLDPWLKDWLTRPSAPNPLPLQVSPSTVALVSANIDYKSLLGALKELISENDQPALDNLKLALQGILLGRDPLTEIIPHMTSTAVLAVEVEPDSAIRRHFPLVGAVGWSVQPSDEMAGPIDNALKTLLAFYCLDHKGRTNHYRIESRATGDARLTLLTNGQRTRMAYRVDRDRLVFGNSPEAIARFGTGEPPSTITDIKTRFFPDAETFAIADLTRLIQEVRLLRIPIVQALAARSKRPVNEADRDLGDLIAVAELFKAASFTSTTSPDASKVRRTIGFLAR